MASAERLWRAGSDPSGLLDAARFLDLVASLRRAQRRFSDARSLHSKALSIACESTRGALLVNQAFTQEQQGNFEGAIVTLRQAGPLVDAEADLRPRFGCRFNLAVNLLHAGRPSEAAELLPEVRARAAQLDNDLDLIRVRWLEGRIHAALGRTAEAVAVLEEVHRAFAAREIAYDTALSALELAALLLEQGRTAEVRPLAAATEAALRAQGVQREALAAAWLFCEAAEREAVTLDLLRRWVKELARA